MLGSFNPFHIVLVLSFLFPQLASQQGGRIKRGKFITQSNFKKRCRGGEIKNEKDSLKIFSTLTYSARGENKLNFCFLWDEDGEKKCQCQVNLWIQTREQDEDQCETGNLQTMGISWQQGKKSAYSSGFAYAAESPARRSLPNVGKFKTRLKSGCGAVFTVWWRSLLRAIVVNRLGIIKSCIREWIILISGSPRWTFNGIKWLSISLTTEKYFHYDRSNWAIKLQALSHFPLGCVLM